MTGFWSGVASILDLFGVLRDPKIDEILSRSDAEAIASDWEAVGQDLRNAAEKVARETEDEASHNPPSKP